MKKHFLLLLSVLMLLIATLSYFFIDKGQLNATEDSYLNNVQNRVQEEIRQNNTDLQAIKSKIYGKIDSDFDQKKISTVHPYYIFKNGKLVFWSDHRFVPEYDMVTTKNSIKTFDCDAGKYISNRLFYTDKQDSIEIFMVINLYRRYNTLNQSKYLKSEFNTELFAVDPIDLKFEIDNVSKRNFYATDKTFIFSVVPPKPDLLKNQIVPTNIIILGIFSILLLGAYILIIVLRLRTERKYEQGFLLLAIYLIGLRIVMLYYQIPFIFNESDLFNSTYYANNDITPSLGDLLLNLFVLVSLLLYITNCYFRTSIYQKLVHSSLIIKTFCSMIFVLGSYGVMLWIYQELNQIYTSSQYQLDLSMSIDFYEKPLKITCLGVFVLISTAYFLAIHLLSNLFIRLNRKNLKVGIGIFLIATVIMLLLCQLGNWCNILLLVLNGIYFLVLYLTEYPRFLYNFKYQTSIYFFVGALVCASLATYVVYRQEIRKDIELKHEFGKKYLAENDPLAEVFIGKAIQKIKIDPMVRKIMFQEAFASSMMNSRIRENDLELYLQQYNLEISMFDKTGRNREIPVVGGDGLDQNSYQAYEKRYKLDKFKTSVPDLFFVNEASNNFNRQYLGFVKLSNPDSSAFGYVVIDLHKSQSTSQGSVFSGLLGSTLEQSPEVANFSYGIFEKNKMLSTGGGLENLNYKKQLPLNLLKSKELYNQGISAYGYKHVGVMGKNGRSIVVSSKEIPVKNIYSTFSFLFLLLVVSIILIIIIFAIRYGFSRLNINFATKIQIYLNIAFLLPLLLVVGITLGILSSTIRESQDSSNMNLTKNICSRFQSYFDQNTKGKLSTPFLIEQLVGASVESGRDVSLYDLNGNLVVSSKETLYEKGLMSKHLNPEAFVHLINDREREKLIPEQLGNLNYEAAYVSMRADDGKLLGVASVPFYDSKASFEKQVVEVIGKILNTFTSIFIVLLLLSYFASNSLTVPLRLITQRIRKTNLDKLNEPLKWKSDDEIGLLIGEYNKMLVKLDESKQALSSSEKQTAWREMAKQVAHEIKNPLTPMKLNLQQIQRMLDTDSPRAKQMMGRTLGSLIDQIDNISDIANSFSEFAIMPVPRNERFDMVRVVNSSVGLYDDEHTTLKLDIPSKEINVLGDRQMMARIITNLILNGIQAVPAWRKPEITVNIKESAEHVTLEVQDNGTGIPENIRQKVFIPNFSTKKEGSGVGLAVAKRGVEHAGGSIWFDTTDDGTTFYINLPLSK